MNLANLTSQTFMTHWGDRCPMHDGWWSGRTQSRAVRDTKSSGLSAQGRWPAHGPGASFNPNLSSRDPLTRQIGVERMSPTGWGSSDFPLSPRCGALGRHQSWRLRDFLCGGSHASCPCIDIFSQRMTASSDHATRLPSLSGGGNWHPETIFSSVRSLILRSWQTSALPTSLGTLLIHVFRGVEKLCSHRKTWCFTFSRLRHL